MKQKLTKKQKETSKEVRGILVDLKGKRCKAPAEEKNILEWNASELNAYIIKKTAGMSVAKRFKFGNNLLKRIREEKAKKLKK